MTRRLYALLLIVSLSLVGAGGAHATAEDPADALLRRGAELRKQDRHDEALELFRKAHALSPSGRTLAEMGLAEFSLKTYVDAEMHLAAALADDSPWIAKNRSVLDQALVDVRKHIAILNMHGPAGMEVAVNGAPMGRLPLARPLHVAEGAVRIEGVAPDGQPTALDGSFGGGREFNVNLDIMPMPAAAGAPTLSTAAPVLAPAPPPESTATWRPWLGAGLIAFSAATLTTGVVWLAVDGNPSCNIPSTAPPGSRCARVYDTKSQGWIAIGVGAAAGLGGGILLWKGRTADMQVGMGPGTLNAFGHF